jgi:hypothetical protein
MTGQRTPFPKRSLKPSTRCQLGPLSIHQFPPRSHHRAVYRHGSAPDDSLEGNRGLLSPQGEGVAESKARLIGHLD